MTNRNRIHLASILILGLMISSPAFSETDDDSIYQLDVKMVDQNGDQVGLDVFRGQPTLVAMFYASCPYACPMLLGKLKSLERELSKKTKEQLRFLLVSLDPKSDPPKVLADVAKRYKTDPKAWRFASPVADEKQSVSADERVREIAAVLGAKYEKRDDGEFNHTSYASLVDKHGVILKKMDIASDPLADIKTAVESLVGR